MQAPLGKIKSLPDAKRAVEEAKAAGKRVVLANGCFDLLHGGHVSYLEDSKAQGDFLVVGLNSDRSMHGLKGPSRPIVPEDERAEMLARMEAVDAVVLFDEPTCQNLLETLRPHVHAKGTDYTRETVPEREISRRLGIETYIAGDPKEGATKDIVKTVVERYGKKN
ncbi:MAG: adenylyltransferase/cytidyltransferase family protein [Candidatus Sumerlaeota bacterium]|nr:adenylyltransferase/cytidyltransferase family protein [Candidatus Sumerlaeota bacterium]